MIKLRHSNVVKMLRLMYYLKLVLVFSVTVLMFLTMYKL